MKLCDVFKDYVRYLFAGRRAEARDVVMTAHDRGITASKLLKQVIWPAMEEIDRLYREDHISRIQEHIAVRINRMIADQLQGYLPRAQKTGRRMVVACGAGELEELGGQVTADLFEAAGWIIWFLGSEVPNDEILQLIGKSEPDILCIYGTRPEGVPELRTLIDMIRGIGVCENMQIMVVGGVFNRAEGLAEEVKADLYAADIEDALKTTEEHPVRIPTPDVPQPGRRRKRKRSPAQAAALRKARMAMGA